MNWKPVKVVGKTLANPDGTVRTLNPSSLSEPYGPYVWSKSPTGTAGQYEVCAIDGSMVGFNPTGHEQVVFGFKTTDPVMVGFSSITVDPL